MPLRRALADWGIPVGVACMVVAFAAGSAFNPRLKHYALDVRWIVLLVVCAAAVFDAFRRLWPTRSLPSRGVLAFSALAGAFLAVAVVSTAWSVAPRLTFERAGTVGILFVLGAALATSTADDTPARVRLFQGLGAGAVVVGFLGVGVLLFDYDASAIQSTATSPWRYRGFTENPNTIAILAGASLPILAALAIRSTSARRQAGWIAGALVMVGSIVASESRGGLLAACAGTLVVTVFGVRGLRRQLVAVAALLVVFGGGLALRQAVQPPPPTFASQIAAPQPLPAQPTQPTKGKPTGTKKNKPLNTKKSGTGDQKPTSKPKPTIQRPKVKTALLPQEQDEIGHPALSKTATTTAASGRVAAWQGALVQIGDRPILGYGFGTEQKVFIDRWYYFQGGTAENSYLGLLMQLGAVGLALVLAMGLALLVGGFTALRVADGDERITVVASLGVIVSAAAIMLFQSYLYSIGNIASTTVWIAMFVLSPIALAPRAARARIRAAAREGIAT
jgi:O-antigen ligase